MRDKITAIEAALPNVDWDLLAKGCEQVHPVQSTDMGIGQVSFKADADGDVFARVRYGPVLVGNLRTREKKIQV